MIGIFGDSQELSFDFNFKVAGDNNHPMKLYYGSILPESPPPPTLSNGSINPLWHEVVDQKIIDKLKSQEISGIVETTQDYVNDYFVPLRDSIEGGRVAVEVEGNTLYNTVRNGNFSKTSISSYWNIYNCDFSKVENNEIFMTTKAGLVDTSFYGMYQRNTNANIGDKVYYFGDIIPPTDGECHIGFENNKKLTTVKSGQWNHFGVISTLLSGVPTSIFYFRGNVVSPGGEIIRFRNLSAINLTQTFGAGKEPSLEWCDVNISNWFDGIQHLDSCVLKSVGKNLFDGELELGGLNLNNGGKFDSTSASRTKNYISLKPGTTYKVTQYGVGKAVNTCFYDKNKSFIQYISGISTINMPLNAFYIRFFYNVNFENTDKFQITEGGAVSPYEPYKEDKIDISSFINSDEKALKRLPNGVCDTFGTDGIITRKVKQIILDGSENCKIATPPPTEIETLFFTLRLYDCLKPLTNGVSNNLICDCLNVKNANSTWTTDVESISLNVNGDLTLRVLKTKLNSHGFVEGNSATYSPALKSWLNKNNITICYELLEPTQEDTKTPINLETQENGYLILDSLIPPYVREWHQTDINDTGNMTWISSTSGLASAFLVEIDLTGVCNSLYGGSNSALRSAFKSLSSRVYMSGSGVDNGVQKNGAYIRAVYNNVNYSQAGWADFGIISSNSITGITISSSSNDRISSANKVYLLVQSRYPSGVDSQGNFVPSILNLDYVSAKVTLSRQPDVVKPVDIEITNEWSMLIKGISPSWSTTDGYVDWRRIFEIGNTTNRLSLQYNNTKGLTLFYWDSPSNAFKTILSLAQREYEKFTSSNIMVQYNKGEFKLYWVTNGNDKFSVNTATKVMDNLEGKLYICRNISDVGGYYSDSFFDSFQYMQNKTWTDEEVELILRGAKEGFEMARINPSFNNSDWSIKRGAILDDYSVRLDKDNENGTAYGSANNNKIPILPNNTYVVSAETTNDFSYYDIIEYNNGNIIKNHWGKKNGYEFTTDPKTTYVRFVILNRSKSYDVTYRNVELKLKM